MSAETQLNAVLKAAGAVTSIVGSGTSARIYPDVVPQEIALPCIAFSRTGTEVLGTLSSAVVSTRASIECWCMASTRAAAETLADAVQSACAAAWFIPSSRRSEYDHEAGLWASVLNLDFWES